ncbi:MAG: PilT/PilU family type 4a pilus ATPase [Candidatus Brocadiae bacterium]|nr:PilT/PilU family type 4a pilus ATPase [Candidatus Brocadiia bacterium]
MENSQKPIDKIFEVAAKHQASDLLLKVNEPPILRIKGSMRTLDAKPLTDGDLEKLVFSFLTREQADDFQKTGDLDMAYSLPEVARFRVNIFRQRGSISMVARRVNSSIPSFEDLHLPSILEKIALYLQGLVLVCGVTGSGKSTTLASMIQHINRNRRCHIVTIEDPIEYMYSDEKSFINQREVGLDVVSFKQALRAVVRQNPDVILVGEMRDHETFSTALTAAETGHLVFGTLHSSTIAQTFGRIYDIFPPEERESVRRSIMFNLRAIICQKLAVTKDNVGRVPVNEIMLMNPTMQKLIEQKQEIKIGEMVRAHEQEGMCDFNQSLYKLIKEGMITDKTGISISHNPEQLKMNLKGIFVSESGIVH